MAGEQSKKKLNKPCVLLIVIAGMERFAFKGVAANLVTYLTDVMKMSNSSAAKTVSSWNGVTSMLPLLVAALADSYWDRYSTILVSSFLYVLGLLALALTATPWLWLPINETSSPSVLFWSLHMISIGQAGYNSSLQAFAADQLELEDELPCCKSDSNTVKKSSFFQWWYFGICSGCLLGVSVMSYIQDTIGWGLGFAIPTLVMVASIASLCCGRRYYIHKRAKPGPNFKSFKNLVLAIKETACKMISNRSVSPKNPYVVELELEEKPFCGEDLDVGEGEEDVTSSGIHPFEIAKVVLHLLPIFSLLLTFAVIFQQPVTFFTKQGMTMKRNIGSSFKIPPAMLQSAITVSIVLLMPLYDTVFIPAARIITRNEKGVSVMQRMAIGMFISVVAMAIAALVETKRLQIGIKTAATETVGLSILWLLPQYTMLGISDIFTVVGMQEFFYSEVPVGMQTMGIALYNSVFGVGSFFSALVISIVDHVSSRKGRQSWFSDNMKAARLDKYYWLLAMASAFSLLVFMVLSRFYRNRV
ncbi:protein NRT1/ PTR FAMILY 5.8-like [Diospyros lotus]|uniref:protein NRT1/ PTR FAMILY 5.8-like n=1 Tax=Diospyros lotus TaxID=55363 RepID=UPI00225A2BF7|nr:protein NRT1/ PTR FAMILY 5.8-like [Diospyros lotus]